MNLIRLVLGWFAFGTLLAACGAALNSPPPGTPPDTTPVVPETVTPPPSTEVVVTSTPPPSETPPPTETPVPAPAADPNAQFSLDLQPIAQGLTRPVLVTYAGDGSNRLFVVEQTGRISILEDGNLSRTPFLDIGDKITTRGNEQGLLGLVFDPHFTENGFFYVNYSRAQDGDNVIERYKVSDDPNVADPNSAKTLLTIDGLEPNHNGGMLAFGPDGYLYIGTGDGGGAGDRHGSIGNGQSLDTLLGKILRIDVNGDPYAVPADNPFVNQAGARSEIWAYGLRNPWRFSFDRATGDLYIADVGQGAIEEVDFQPAASRGGENYGWRLAEGSQCYNPRDNCDTSNLVMPIAEYSHDFGCSITGGYVYRGQEFPVLVGQYLFADYCTGIVWATARDASGTWHTRQVGKFDDTISSFGEDAVGELYVVGHGSGTIYKLTASQ